MAVNSRTKGAVAEREVARILNSYGYNCRRGQQYCGANGDADVVGLPGIHIEVKRREKLNLYDAMDQSKRDAAVSGGLPSVFWRKNNCEWLVVMTPEDWMRLYKGAQNGADWQ